MSEPLSRMGSTRISDDRKRGLDYAPALAIAAYEVEEIDGELIGRRCGIFGNTADAESWLATGEPKPMPLHAPLSDSGNTNTSAEPAE